jgi:hypothetical protein
VRGQRNSPEMQRLIITFTGDWHVQETVEITASGKGTTRQDSASFHAGPGPLSSRIETGCPCRTLKFLGDFLVGPGIAAVSTPLPRQRCGMCVARDSPMESNTLVNSWEETENGKKVKYSGSFLNLSSSSFRLVSEGSSAGTTICRVITDYRRLHGERSH